MKLRSKKLNLVLGGLLILFGAMALIETLFSLGTWIWIAVLMASGIGIFGIYTIDRTERFLLIISYVLVVVALFVALLTLNILRDPFIASFVLLAVAFPFFVAFMQNGRKMWGLLLPVYVLLAVSMMVPLIESGFLVDTLVAAYVLFAVSIPFFVVYARDSSKWWALIPAGITAVIGLFFIITEKAAAYAAPIGLIIAGAWVLFRQLTKKGRKKQ